MSLKFWFQMGGIKLLNSFLQTFSFQTIRKIGAFNFFLFLSGVFEHGLNKLILMPFLVRHLGAGKFGSFVLAMSVVLFLATIIPSGVFMTNYRENANFKKKEKREFFETTFTVLVITTTVFAIIYFISKKLIATIFTDSNITVFVPFLAGYLVCYVIFNFCKQILAINLKFNVRTFFDVIYGSFICLLIPGFFIFGDAGVAGGYFLGSLVAVVAILFYLRKKHLLRFFRLSGQKLKLILKSAPTFTLASSALIIMSIADRWIVGFYWPESQVTYYYVAVQMAALFVLPFSMLNSVLNPIVTKRNSLNDFTRAEIKFFFFAIAGSILLVLFSGWLLGPWVIKMLYGQNILSYSRIPFNIILMGQLFYLVRIYSQPFLIKFFSPNLSRNIQWLSAGTFIVLHLILVPRYGIIGGGIATASAFALMGVLCFKDVVLTIKNRVFQLETL